MPELWDGYRADGTLAGCDLVRGEPIPDGLYHLVSEVLVRHTDGAYLLMQRCLKKAHYPGRFEATAGGAVWKGETPEAAARRELREETGLSAHRLTPLYRVRCEKVIFHGFFCIVDCGKDAIVLQEGETISHLWLCGEEFRAFLDSDAYVPSQRGRLLPHWDRIKRIE